MASQANAGAIGTDVAHAAALLRQGALVAIPTETVYGLAANALDSAAVASVFAAKQRPAFDPLIVHGASLVALLPFVQDVPSPALRLAEAFWPGPLTLLLPKTAAVPDLVTAGSARVALRVPAHPLTLTLLQDLAFPLAAPSANPFGYISPTTPLHVAAQLGAKVAYILDGGPSAVGLESTIVGWEDGQATVYRLGGLRVDAIEAVVGPVAVRPHSSSNPAAPGMLASHYAPRVPLRLGNRAQLAAWAAEAQSAPPVAALLWQAPLPQLPPERQQVLSPTGDDRAAAARLFAALRELDALPVAEIWAEAAPEVGLGRAINDRLRRAAARRG